MPLELFAGISVADYPAALAWYEKLFGKPSTFSPNDVESVWELAEGRSVYVEHRPSHAGHALTTVFLDDLDAFADGAEQRGITPALRETYDNGVRKYTYRDPEGNEIGFGGAPV
jgi:predicted enzyme related to lactoylglutathione lyase